MPEKIRSKDYPELDADALESLQLYGEEVPDVLLPRRLSTLLRLAVHDAMACERDPRFRLQMSGWFVPSNYVNNRVVCNVCMAGAVMAQTLRVAMTDVLAPMSIEGANRMSNAKALHEINSMRDGSLESTSPAMTRAMLLISRHYSLFNGRAPWETYLEAADIMEAGGA